jgi:RNA polymerase sigma factor (sigma-70 family)
MEENKNILLFNKILEDYRYILNKVSRIYCIDPDDRQDLIQEISIQIWRSFSRYNDKYKITTWIYKIALNVAISHYRKASREKTYAITADHNLHPELQKSENEEKLIMLEQFINELNDLDKALMLLYLEDRSHSEIADILGISKSNTGTKVSRIKEKLKHRFNKLNY